MTDKSQLEEVKVNIRSLIQSQTNKFYTILHLQKDYNDIMGHNIPLLGHRNVELFLRNMPDVVKISGYGLQARLEYIPTSKSKHIGEMIKNQRQCSGRPRRRKTTRSENHFHTRTSIQLPQYNDESDWDKPVENKDQQQSVKKKNANINLDDCPSGQDSGSNADTNQEKKFDNPRTRILKEIRKKAEQRASLTPSSSSTFASEPADHISQTTTYRGYKHIFNKIKQNEAEKNQKELAEATVTKNDVVQPKIGSTKPISHFRSKPQAELNPQNCDSDESEAIPAGAVTELVERLNSARIEQLPTGLNLSEISLPKININKKFEVGEILQLVIIEVESPLAFYFHLYEEIDDFRFLQNEIQNIYSTLARGELHMSEYNLCSGAICAANFNNSWYRAMICSVPNDPNEFSKIKLFLVDYGIFCELANRHLKFLLPRFSHTPAQAICGRLANIKPGAYSRQSEASIYFMQMVLETHLYGYVKSIGAKNQQVELILVDTNFTPRRKIDTELIKSGLVDEA